jgi:hypothetical protein
MKQFTTQLGQLSTVMFSFLGTYCFFICHIPWRIPDYLLSRKHYYGISELTALIHSVLTLFAFALKVVANDEIQNPKKVKRRRGERGWDGD